jgi:hypothetical protein
MDSLIHNCDNPGANRLHLLLLQGLVRLAASDGAPVALRRLKVRRRQLNAGVMSAIRVALKTAYGAEAGLGLLEVLLGSLSKSESFSSTRAAREVLQWGLPPLLLRWFDDAKHAVEQRLSVVVISRMATLMAVCSSVRDMVSTDLIQTMKGLKTKTQSPARDLALREFLSTFDRTKDAPPTLYTCANCNALEIARPFSRCDRCRQVKYCSKKCQREHWTRGAHKSVCKCCVA